MSDPVARLNAALDGRYAIERELGEGGMATVYLAKDLKHNRNVALKVLKPELAAVVGAERFLAEIQTTANLQHPHILPLFDSGEADSFLFYVMPYVEGETLKERIDREKQLPVDEAVRITTAVASALDHAHRHKVIHRDIKPANILLQDGQPVVSDFGIALALGISGSNRLTETGLSVGTPFYMSPEQATGDQPVGASTDTYALGSVLYEMLVGEPPYPGTTAQAVLGKIISGKPVSTAEHRPSVPANVDAAVRKALEKLPADRFTGAQDFANALANPGFRHGEEATAEVAGGAGPWKSVSIATAGLAVVLALALGWSLSRSESPPNGRFNINLPDSVPMAFIGAAPLGVGRQAFDVSDDGTQFVYTGVQDGTVRLFLRPFDSFQATAIPGTEGAFGPFFSPDGRWVGFFVGNQLMKVRTDGGAPIPLAEAPNAVGADWSDGYIVYAVDEDHRLLRVSEQGGDVVDLSVPGRGHGWPRILPGSEAILMSSVSPWILDPSSGEPIDLPIDAEDARYVSSGHLIFLRGSDLHAVRFDLPNLVITGPSVPVLSGVRTEVYNLGQWDVTSDGTLVYAAGRRVAEGRFTWVGADGSRTDLGLPTRARGTFEISPDGTRLAVAEWAPGQNHIWIYDLERGTPSQLTVAGDHEGALAWSPNGTELMYHKVLDDTLWAPHVQSVDGGEEPRRILPGQDGPRAHSWSADGRFGLEQSDHLILFDPETENVVDIPNTHPTSWGIVVSPLGDAVAYTSGHTGEYHNYVQLLPATGDAKQVSLEGGAEEPRWSRDGRFLYYRSGQRIMVATVTIDPELSVGTPTVFFEGDFVNVGFRSYDISLDGTRALIIDGGVGTTTALNVVQGWLTEVEELIQEAEASGGR